jgi:LacI family sucrose operon transcriptional repressor
MTTLKDVAEEAGLAVSTVSRILNNRGYISEEAREKVNLAVKKLNYHPNELARSLHSKNTNKIGLIVPFIQHPYFSQMISCLEQHAYNKGYEILLIRSQRKGEREKQYMEICARNRVAGIILCSGGVAVEKLQKLDVPVITLERNLDGGTASVECDNIQGGMLAAERLINGGCHKLIHISNTSGISMPADNRSEGFRKVCEEQGISYLEIEAQDVQFKDMTYDEVMEQTLIEYPDIDGIFANSDVIAAQALQVCRKLQINVPEQMKIVGFDDTFIAKITNPQVTTIHQPIEEMAEIAVNLLNMAVSGKQVPKITVLPVYLVERETT